MVIHLKNYIRSAYTNDEGNIVFNILKEHITDSSIEISFEGFDIVSSSFVNSAFVPLLNDYPLSFIKSQIRFIDSNKQINEMIKKRLVFESARSCQ